MQTAVNYFAIFGGLDIKLDLSKPLRTLIIRHILDEFYEIHDYIEKKTKNSSLYHKILTGASLGDRRINSAFKRADLEYEEAIESIEKLEELEFITQETSMDFLTNQFEENETADKLLFTTPFLRFWFAFVSPLYKGIAREDYDECFKKFDNYQAEFMDLVFEQLCHEYIKVIFEDDEIEEIGRYWDDEKREINILAQTRSGKVIVGSSKYSNSKMKNSEIGKLKELCEKLEIVPDYVVLFSKNGFTNELKSQKNESLKLYTVKSLKGLL
ncbi:DUF234 domain-containing protein [Halarcobacter bivalviorum]|uniref:DUF234 domain-containing protein n=1 Tax=Halarcobacter bivalviorum TaxID=663364 RepID=A0AAX2A646_9BACT|nr:DUF234 domain-containing protein [Halarcobacter bivalviorum]AXH11445.1 DUF234 domain-containing protein [Halarcobacter bivalviorum]RXK05341.1 hypothetical protein CRU97_08335 [Halarcobacter bivalviorum]RXK09369.1 hypothetical protein CRV05_10600 [Halarcobacter bivalviorum]